MPPRAAQVGAAALGLAGPIAAATLVGRPELGVAMSLGGLALSGGTTDTFHGQARSLLYGLLAGSAAMVTGSFLIRLGVLVILTIPILAAVAGLVGGISRPLARASTQFLLYTVIAAHFQGQESRPIAMAALFALGAAWTAGLSLGLRRLLEAFHLPPNSRGSSESLPPQKPPMRAMLRRWWKTLTHFSAWQYTLRITLCLAAAEAFAWCWPDHHGYWAAVTVVIVVQRNLDTVLKRTLQRAAGTAIGVLIAGGFLLAAPPPWGVIAIIAVFAGARPLLLKANYLAYAAVMTPLVLLLLDYGQAPSLSLLIDRLVATLVGCTLALTFGLVGWSKLTPRNS